MVKKAWRMLAESIAEELTCPPIPEKNTEAVKWALLWAQVELELAVAPPGLYKLPNGAYFYK